MPHQNSDLSLPGSVALLYSLVEPEFFPTHEQYLTEKSAKNDAQVIAVYLENMGVETRLFPGTPDVVSSLQSFKPDMVINLVGSVRGQEYLAAMIPGILEGMDIPYTGAGILGESLAYNKYLVKELLESHGVPVPMSQLVVTHHQTLRADMRYPLISKLNEIHGGVEITPDAVAVDEKSLRERLRFLLSTYCQPVLVEEFVVGKEVTAILLEGLNKKVYMAEKVFNKSDERFVFATFDDQWHEGSDGYHYEKYSDLQLANHVKKAFDILKMSDYAKFDIRIDQSGRYYFIDSNSNPAFGPKELDVAIATILDLYGVSFSEILRRLMVNTMRDARGVPLLPVV